MSRYFFKEFNILPIDQSRISDYISLFDDAYPNFSPTQEYLRWLYFENPLGNVIGFDAYDEDKIISHYACIPTKVDGFEGLSLLALNTATHPKYQGRGLLKVLANRTYEFAGDNFAGVFGVANSKAVNALVRHLNFVQLGNLELRFGNLFRTHVGSRVYSEREIAWRSRCPGKALKRKKIMPALEKVTTKPFGPLINVSALVHLDKAENLQVNYLKLKFR